VHHGLQAAADDFAAHCQTWCDLWSVPLVVTHVNAHPSSGESPEDAARQARYQAYAQALKTHWGGIIQDIALAQHADDQVETVLLALSRGAGLPGLSAMPALAERGGLRIHRPWLDVPAQQLRDWLVQEGVSWVEDPTNRNLQFRRNALRHSLTEEMRAQLLADARDAGRARATRDVAQAKAAARVILSLTSASVTCNREQFNALPPEHATRLLADMLTALGGGTTRPRQHETRRLYHAMLEPAFTAATLGHCHIETRQHMLHIRREQRKIASGNAAFSPAKPLAASPFWWL
jgi:tRNA(Ile)-lysidine synthase